MALMKFVNKCNQNLKWKIGRKILFKKSSLTQVHLTWFVSAELRTDVMLASRPEPEVVSSKPEVVFDNVPPEQPLTLFSLVADIVRPWFVLRAISSTTTVDKSKNTKKTNRQTFKASQDLRLRRRKKEGCHSCSENSVSTVMKSRRVKVSTVVVIDTVGRRPSSAAFDAKRIKCRQCRKQVSLRSTRNRRHTTSRLSSNNVERRTPNHCRRRNLVDVSSRKAKRIWKESQVFVPSLESAASNVDLRRRVIRSEELRASGINFFWRRDESESRFLTSLSFHSIYNVWNF